MEGVNEDKRRYYENRKQIHSKDNYKRKSHYMKILIDKHLKTDIDRYQRKKRYSK